MPYQFICHSGCSTCQKARRWLQERGIPFEEREIRQQNPTAQEIEGWSRRAGIPLRRFFNTSGQLYRSMQLKDRLPAMDEQQQLALLASDGMLVRRPILVGETAVLVGFREKEWQAALEERK